MSYHPEYNGVVGNTYLDWEACNHCLYRQADNQPCDDGELIIDDLEDVVCDHFKYGDPKTPEEIEAEKETALKTEIDKYQEKLEL